MPEQRHTWKRGVALCGQLVLEARLPGRRRVVTCRGVPVPSYVNKPCFYVRLVPKLFYKCDQGQADPVVAVARDQSSVYLKPLMHEAQPASHFSASTVTRYLAARPRGARSSC